MFLNPGSRALAVRPQGNFVYNTATSLWVPAPGDGTNGAYVQGSVASGSADSGNPIKVGAISKTTPLTITDGQRSDLTTDTRQNLRVTILANNSNTPLVVNTPGDGDNGFNDLKSYWLYYNGTTFDRPRSNVDTAALVTLTAASAGTTNSTDQTNYNGRGVQIGVNITATTAQTLTVNIQGKDNASGTYYTLLSSSALAAVAFSNMTVYPGITVSANLDVSDVLPRVWRVQAVVAGAGSTLSATIGASVIL